MRPGKEIVSWVLGGALLASVGMNAHLYRTQARQPTTPCGMSECAPMAFVGGPEQIDQSLRKLCLSQEQRDKLTGCCKNCCMEMIGLGDSLRAGMNELQAALREQPIDEAHVETLVDEVKELWGRRLENSVHSVLNVRETLNQDQLNILLGAEEEIAESDSN